MPGLKVIPEVEIVGVCKHSRESSPRVADAFPIPKVYAAIRWVRLVEHVFARGRVFTSHRHNAETGAMDTVDVPDHINIITELPNSAQATYTFSSVCGLAPGSGPCPNQRKRYVYHQR